jgi:hypothetical protein
LRDAYQSRTALESRYAPEARPAHRCRPWSRRLCPAQAQMPSTAATARVLKIFPNLFSRV